MGLHIINEAERCLNCKKPMCQQACPVHTPIPHIIQMFKENRLMEAGSELFENNPMSVICATVCNHEAQCAGHCALGKKGSPVQFYEIEKFISDAYLERMALPETEKKGKQVAVIGSGPAGMTVAIMLAKNGYDVTIFDEKDQIGGMLQYGIPEFRLPKTVLKRYKNLLLRMGIQIRPNTVMGGALTIEDLFRDGYASVFVGTGVWRPKTLGIQGESLANVHYGISYLANPAAYDLGENVAVIGMGNVAMDVARTAFRNGAQKVTLYARGKHISASSQELEYAKLDGAELVFGKAIERITPEGPVFKISIMDEDGKVIGYEEEREQVQADSTIIAASQGPKNKLVMTTHNLKSSDRGLLIVDENNMTTRSSVFAAGDVVHGSKTVVHAVEEAKKAALAMMRYMEEDQNESCHCD
ncbi:MAG: NAD(P)-dependent oxidoreductase [Lachnospiraceae bacterium]|nr:NAD(P)-dependent oxidoreductase [Lachnospiraceae bacterium]